MFGFSFYQNADSGLCVAMGRDQGLDLLKQEICDVKSEEQKFTCKGNTVTPEKDSGLCVTASGKLFGYIFLKPDISDILRLSFINYLRCIQPQA